MRARLVSPARLLAAALALLASAAPVPSAASAQGSPHGDNHDLWIAPNDPQRMVNANDGGATVSVDGGRTWTEQDFATAQWYHVDVTNEWPYRI